MLTFIDFLEKINAPHLTTESNILYNPQRSLDPDSVDVGMPLTEAQFTSDKLDKVTKLYGKLFGKKFGGEFKVTFTEEFQRQDGTKGFGYRLFNKHGYQLRFGFLKGNITAFKETPKRDTFIVDSLDYWDKDNHELDRPTITCNFSSSCNVVQIYEKLCELLRKKKVGTFKLDDFITEAVDLGRSTIVQRQNFLRDRNKKVSAALPGKFADYVEQEGLEDEWNEFYATLEKGKKETNSVQNNVISTQKQFDDNVYADPKYVFEDIKTVTEFVAKGGSKSLIICGEGGTGKTYEVTSTLKRVLGEAGDKYTYHSGAKIAPRSFYSTVFRERDVLQVWDEADDILSQPDTIMMLKPALDTSGKPAMEYITGTYPMNGKSEAEIRDYCAQCDDADSLVFTQNVNKVKDGEMVVPSKFYFDGEMIFISNMRASQIEDAIKSRSIFIDVYLCARDMYNRTKSIMKAKYPNKSDEQLDKFFEALGMAIPDADEEVTYMTPEIARKRKPLTIRSAVIGMALQDAGVESWARIASMYV
jgi:hypothetical protein